MSSLLRSTKFVRYFAGAARTLILNSAKTAEANLLINSKALCVANNVLMRDYATSKKTESLEPLLQRLDSEVRRFGRISKRDIDEVFDELRGEHDITSSQSLLVIRCCGELVPEELPEQRTLLVQKIWAVLSERGVPMDISHYNALLRVYIENEHPFSPAEFLNELEKKGLQPNRVTYQRLMWRYCQEGDVDGATKVLEKMRELSLPVSEPVLNALVMGHAFHGDTDGARAVLETMAGAGLQPTNRTYALLACGFAKKGDLEGVEKVLKDANDKDAYMTDKDILDIMESLAIGGHGEKIESLFGHLQKGNGYIQDVCNLILRLINKGQESVAVNLMKTMPNKSDSETLYKGAFFIKQLLKVQKSPESIVKTCRELQQDNVIPNAVYIATEGALLHGNSELALLLFKELEKDGIEVRQHFYWPLLVKKGKENDEEGVLHLLRSMSNAGLTPTGECLRDYVIPYLMKKDSPQNIMLKLQVANVPRILSARNVMVELLEAGQAKEAAKVALEYRPFGQFNLVGRPLVVALSKTRDIKSFVTVLHVISSKLSQTEEDVGNDDTQAGQETDTNAIGRIVLSAMKNIPNTMFEELLNEIHAKGLTISTSSAEAIEAYIGQNLTGAISEKLAQLTSADLELAPIELIRRTDSTSGVRSSALLEKLVQQAKSKGSYNVTRLQRQLLILYVQENNMEKVNSYLKELESENFEFSNPSLAMLCEFYAQNGDLEKALAYKQTLESKEPVFLLNKYKLLQIASAYIKADRFEEAVKFLTESQSDSHEGSTFSLNSRCWQLLNYLAEAKEVGKVKTLTQTLLDKAYIEPTNVLLGPSIKVHLLTDDIEGGLQEFERCCKQYRSTPWKGELMKALILKEDAAKLQWLADLSTQIHGEVNILHDLVLAFVECGRLRQARRILETPGMQTRQKRLHDACERYVQEGKSKYLEGLLEATRELSYIDRANIFYHLLVTYCKANETDKALGLWTLLQEEGEVPSEAFLSCLGSHLKANNRPVPFAYVSTETKPKVKPEQRSQPSVSKKDVSEKIESLVKEEKLSEALETSLKSFKEGVNPKANVLKYMLKSLAEKGDVEMIQKLGAVLGGTMKRNVTYDDKLTLAVFVRGNGAQHVDTLTKNVLNANSEKELENALTQFPRSNALASVVNSDELVGKCHKVAEIAASKGHYVPANLLWTEYLLAGKEQEADNLWNNYLKNATVIAYRRLLQEAHTRNQPQLAEKLISSLKSSQTGTPPTLGNVYSRVINLHLANSNLEDARLTLERALSDGCTTENITKTTLKRLKESLESVGQEFKYAIP